MEIKEKLENNDAETIHNHKDLAHDVLAGFLCLFVCF